MQTSSKVSYDNWSDWNLGDKIMNIRPVGTYCFCHCHHCHHHHHCVDCEFKDSCVKCDHCDCCEHHCDCDCEYCKHDHCDCCEHHCDCNCEHCKHDHCDFNCEHCKHDRCCQPAPPCPPHHHHHCDCHDPHLFPIDTDGDGFVEGDLIHKVPENYIPNPIPDNIGNNTDKNEDSSIDTTSCYGIPLVDSIPDEIEPVETSDDVDSILNDVDDLNLNTESNDIFEEQNEDSDNAVDELIETFGSDDDTWSTAKLMDTDSHEIIAESPVEEPELKEVEPVIEEEKPTRGRRRVNRGGRRKKED